mgnify:CR=1 FL=1
MSAVPPQKPVLGVIDAEKWYGAQLILKGVSLTVNEGDRLGLIGRNGCGKSTLMRIMAGVEAVDAGEVTRARGLRAALLRQDCLLDLSWTVGDALRDAAEEANDLLAAYHDTVRRLSETPGDCWEHRELQEECDRLHHALDVGGGWTPEQEARRVATALRLPPEDRPLSSLSGGELRRVDLAHKIASRPDVLLLDEPTNHIDTDSIAWIESFLESYEGTCILVTHDRYFLDRVVTRIAELEFGKVYSFPGGYSRFLEYKCAVDETRARTEDNRLAFIRRELAWYRRGAQARSTKQKARIGRLMETVEDGPPPVHREFLFEIPEPERLSKNILEVRQAAHGYNGAPLFRQFSLFMQKGMRMGIIGPNGCGKSTLLRVLMGLEKPADGEVLIGESTRFLYLDQAHADVDPARSILDFVAGGARFWDVGNHRLFVPAYIEKFLYDRESVDMPMGNLSGGERNRLDLVRRLLRGGNFLVLDEPTNDLDLFTLRLLEETVLAFDGCALIVSHDRYFLNRVCTHLLVFEDDGRITQITGGYDDYLLHRERRGEEAREVRRADAARERAQRQTAPAPAPSGPRRLTYNEKRELAGMEADILAAEEEAARLEAEVQAPAFYTGPREDTARVLADLEAARARIETLYRRWQELEALEKGSGA